jgi:hypothetical protein
VRLSSPIRHVPSPSAGTVPPPGSLTGLMRTF